MKKLATILGLMSLFYASTSAAQCEVNVDKLQLVYINGMFTSPEVAKKNVSALNRFQDKYLYTFEKASGVEYSYNYSETLLLQIAEVAFHKMTDEQYEAGYGRFLNRLVSGKDVSVLEDAAEMLAWFYSTVIEKVDSLMQEYDYTAAERVVESQVGMCARTVLVTHSQGNFYGNAVYTSVSYSYVYPNQAALSDYPMLGYMGIANPTYSVGGYYGQQVPEIAKTFTNANDLIMLAVRLAYGAVPSDSVYANLLSDPTGHGLEAAYLNNRGAPVIAQRIIDTVNGLTPYPMFEQHRVSSSAISNIGYSEISHMLDVRFKYGGGYRYYDVPEYIGNAFINASSHGTYFNDFIKDQYDYEKIEG